MAFVKIAARLSAVVLAMAPLRSSAGFHWGTGPTPPLHPTIVFGTYKNEQVPIIGVRRDEPQAEVAGKRVTLSSGRTASYTPERALDYAPGSLSLKNLHVSSSKTNLILMFDTGGEVDNGTIYADSDFAATIVPTQDYKDCYVALVFFDEGYLEGTTNVPGATVQFEQIPDLVAGRENKVKLTFGYLDFGARATGYFPLFFTRGREIRSSQADLVARFFAKLEQAKHERIVQGYKSKNEGKSAPPQPYLRFPPYFPDPSVLADAPRSVNVSFMVAEDGSVESVILKDPPKEPIASILRQTIGGWRFLPRLKDGYAARTMVTIPIVLKPDEK